MVGRGKENRAQSAQGRGGPIRGHVRGRGQTVCGIQRMTGDLGMTSGTCSSGAAAQIAKPSLAKSLPLVKDNRVDVKAHPPSKNVEMEVSQDTQTPCVAAGAGNFDTSTAVSQ